MLMNKLILPTLLIIGVLVISGCTQGGQPDTKTSPTDKPADTQIDVFGKYTNSDVAECKKIEDSYEKDVCYYDVAFRGGKGETVCENIGDSKTKLRDILIRDMCYQNIASDKAKIPGYSAEAKNICEQIQTLSMKDGCYFDVAILTGDKELCKRFEGTGNRDEGTGNSDGCYYYIAIGSGDPILCEKIVDISQKNNCISSIKQTT